eukprot:scaffold35915_cov90-Isochrysis_galbana.AAC.2
MARVRGQALTRGMQDPTATHRVVRVHLCLELYVGAVLCHFLERDPHVHGTVGAEPQLHHRRRLCVGARLDNWAAALRPQLHHFVLVSPQDEVDAAGPRERLVGGDGLMGERNHMRNAKLGPKPCCPPLS